MDTQDKVGYVLSPLREMCCFDLHELAERARLSQAFAVVALGRYSPTTSSLKKLVNSIDELIKLAENKEADDSDDSDSDAAGAAKTDDDSDDSDSDAAGVKRARTGA